MRPTTVDPRLVAAAKGWYPRITSELSRRGPLVDLDYLDDVIAQLVGVRAVLTGDLYSTDEGTRRGLRRMLEACREWTAESLSSWKRASDLASRWRDEQGDSDAEADMRHQRREDDLKAEIALMDAEIHRLNAEAS
jgi:hypothetical protein